MGDIRPLNIRVPSFNRRDTIEVSVSELLEEINNRFDSKPLVPLRNPLRPRPTHGQSPLRKPTVDAKPKSVLRSNSTVNVFSPNSACGSSWVVVHTNENALKDGASSLTRSASFNDVEEILRARASFSCSESSSLVSPGSVTSPNAPASSSPESHAAQTVSPGQLTNMRNGPLVISPMSSSGSPSVSIADGIAKPTDTKVAARRRAVSTLVRPKATQSRIIFPKPSPRLSRYNSRKYAQGTRPITRANSANSIELIWKPGWTSSSNNNANTDGNAKEEKADDGDVHPRKLQPEMKRNVKGKEKSLPPPPPPVPKKDAKNTVPFPSKPPPMTRPSFGRSFLAFSSESDLEDERSFNLLDLVVKLKKRLARLSRKGVLVNQNPSNSSKGETTIPETETQPTKASVKPKRKVSFLLPEQKKERRHPTFFRRPSPYPKDQIAAVEDEEDEEGQSECEDQNAKEIPTPGERSESEEIRPLKRTDDFMEAM